MVHFIPIQVGCYSGYKADEYPKCFYRDDEKFEIEEVTDRWYQSENNPEWPPSNYFKVKVTNGMQHIIKHDLRSNRWFLCEKNS